MVRKTTDNLDSATAIGDRSGRDEGAAIPVNLGPIVQLTNTGARPARPPARSALGTRATPDHRLDEATLEVRSLAGEVAGEATSLLRLFSRFSRFSRCVAESGLIHIKRRRCAAPGPASAPALPRRPAVARRATRREAHEPRRLIRTPT